MERIEYDTNVMNVAHVSGAGANLKKSEAERRKKEEEREKKRSH